MIKRQRKLLAYKLFVPFAAQNKVAKSRSVITYTILITYKNLDE